jgi:fatty-acyl-CoA synthase
VAAALPNFDIPYTRSWTYTQFRDQSVRHAHLFLRRLGRIDDSRPGHVAVLLENHLEFLSVYGGCAYGGLTLFGINTGLRGDTLAGVLNHSRARLVVVDEAYLPHVERIQGSLKHIPAENVLVRRAPDSTASEGHDLAACLRDEVGPEDRSLDAPDVRVTPEQNLMVIYTSGTTGLPKGINNNHFKLLAAGIGVANNMGLTPDDVGYVSMPLFHSNSMFVGFSPAFWIGHPRALQRQPVRPGRVLVWGDLLELRGRARPLRAVGDRARLRSGRGAHPGRGDAQPEEPHAARGWQRRRAP